MVNEEWDKMTAPGIFNLPVKWIGACHEALKD